jgi:CubicO group peptidase (beta-lactamase class C family)
MESLKLIDGWPVHRAAAGVATAAGVLATHGLVDEVLPWASVTKLATALAVLVASEEGVVDLDESVPPFGATVRDLLAHASGLAPDHPVRRLAEPGTRRIYSNAGFDVLGEHLAAAAGIPFGDYLQEAVLAPIGMSATLYAGSPASGLRGPLLDLLRLGAELLSPQVVDASTLAMATTTFRPGLPGVLPGFGHQEDCAFGLGFEVRDGKSPHWTAPDGPAATFGHFGRSGAFVWVDVEAGIACATVADRDFGAWALEAWPALSGAVLHEWRSGRTSRQVTAAG